MGTHKFQSRGKCSFFPEEFFFFIHFVMQGMHM